MQENFRPPIHFGRTTFFEKVIFQLRLFTDFQFLTVYQAIKKNSKYFKGKVIDIGCGNCPFEDLLSSPEIEYIPLDVDYADKWDYSNPKIIKFNGSHLPLMSDSIEHFICTEVIEHIEDPNELIAEMQRVLVEGGKGIITLPWSARFHYKPYDFHRYTPSFLKILFKNFSKVEILNRGTDINAIVNKSIVLYLGMITGILNNLLAFPFRLIASILLLPFICLLVIWGHLALIFNLGSNDDPLGYTIIVTK